MCLLTSDPLSIDWPSPSDVCMIEITLWDCQSRFRFVVVPFLPLFKYSDRMAVLLFLTANLKTYFWKTGFVYLNENRFYFISSQHFFHWPPLLCAPRNALSFVLRYVHFWASSKVFAPFSINNLKNFNLKKLMTKIYFIHLNNRKKTAYWFGATNALPSI